MLRLGAPMLLFLLTIPGYSQIEGKDFLKFEIYFGGGSYHIDQLQRERLYEFIGNIEKLENFTISVHSHTDNIGGAAYNEWLSEMRGESVIELLENGQIRREIISKRDFGQFNPVYDNSTWMGKLKNRRVDIIFWPVIM